VVSSSSSDVEMTNDDMQGMCKESAMASFTVLSWDLPGGTEERHENAQSV
jgi:hypothetical protein